MPAISPKLSRWSMNNIRPRSLRLWWRLHQELVHLCHLSLLPILHFQHPSQASPLTAGVSFDRWRSVAMQAIASPNPSNHSRKYQVHPCRFESQAPHAYTCASWIGPKGLPIVGSLFDLIRGSTKAGDDFLFHQVALKYGPIAKVITLGESKYYYKNWRGREWGRNRPRPQSNTCTHSAMRLPLQ